MKRVLKLLAMLLAAVIIIAGAYVYYVFSTYYRLPDDTVNGLYIHGTGETARTEQKYTALSYNIGFGAYSQDFGFFMDGGEYARARSRSEVERNVNASIDIVRQADADIVFFQEVDVQGQRSHNVDQAAMIREAFDDKCRIYTQNYHSPYLLYPLKEPIGSNRSGIMTVTDLGITFALRRSLPIDTGFMKLLDLDRCYTASRVPVDNGRELVLYNVHLTAYSNDESIVRSQVQMLAEDMAAEYAAGNYVVCGGDFNCDLPGDSSERFGTDAVFSWAQPFDKSLLPEGLTLVAPVDNEAPVPSARNADGPYVPGESFVIIIDGFIVSDNVRVLHADTIDAGFMYSDHNPVRMEFELMAQ